MGSVPSPRFERREMLQVGFSAALGLGLADLRGAAASTKLKPRAKSVIFVFCTGAPAHQDMWDLKPEAPAESRGEFKPVDTKAPGVRISEHLPKLAGIADKFAVVRSMTHKLPSHEHGTHYLLTGINQNPPGATHMASRNDWPCYAAGLQYLRGGDDGLPAGVHLPTYLHNGYGFCGQNGGFLGSKYDPWQITRDPNDPKFQLDELTLSQGVTVERVSARHELLASIDRRRHDLVDSADVRSMSQRKLESFDMLVQGGKFREAFELEREPAAMRDRYGRHAFGQSLLLSRRLVEAGVPIVQANMGTMNRWDTHNANFRALKDTLLPPFDQGLSALLTDLDERGLLDETLVVCTGEFGRTPLINANVGRDHWPRVAFGLLAGGGLRTGQVIGATDRLGGEAIERPVKFGELFATLYHTLGIDVRHATLDDLSGRPQYLVDAGAEPLAELV